MAILTHHSRERMKERTGLHGRAQVRAAETAWKCGVSAGDVAGKMHRYLVKLSCEHGVAGRVVKVWAEQVWCFSPTGVLVTVFRLPREFRNAAHRAADRFDENRIEHSESPLALSDHQRFGMEDEGR